MHDLSVSKAIFSMESLLFLNTIQQSFWSFEGVVEFKRCEVPHQKNNAVVLIGDTVQYADETEGKSLEQLCSKEYITYFT